MDCTESSRIGCLPWHWIEEIEDDQDEVEHLAYMAKQQVAIARAETRGRAAKAEVQQSLERQDEIVTQALADEAETAQLQAQQLEQETRALEQELAALKAEKTERGYVLTLGDVLFGVDRSSLKPGAQRNLYQLVTFLKLIFYSQGRCNRKNFNKINGWFCAAADV